MPQSGLDGPSVRSLFSRVCSTECRVSRHCRRLRRTSPSAFVAPIFLTELRCELAEALAEARSRASRRKADNLPLCASALREWGKAGAAARSGDRAAAMKKGLPGVGPKLHRRTFGAIDGSKYSARAANSRAKYGRVWRMDATSTGASTGHPSVSHSQRLAEVPPRLSKPRRVWARVDSVRAGTSLPHVRIECPRRYGPR